MTLIVLMAWGVFWIDPRDFGPQIALPTSSVFALIAFQIGTSASLPKVAYLTGADRFILGATLLVFAALGEAICTGRLARGGREELARRIDRISRVVYLALFAVVLWSTT